MHPVLTGCDLVLDLHSPARIPSQANGDADIVINALGDCFGNTHHRENGSGVTAAHEIARHGYDR